MEDQVDNTIKVKDATKKVKKGRAKEVKEQQEKRRTFTIYKFLKLQEVSPYQLITTGW